MLRLHQNFPITVPLLLHKEYKQSPTDLSVGRYQPNWPITDILASESDMCLIGTTLYLRGCLVNNRYDNELSVQFTVSVH